MGYPSGVYAPRTKSNKVGVIYDPDIPTTLFAQDITLLDAEVVAIEIDLIAKIDQALKTTSSPQFANLAITAEKKLTVLKTISLTSPDDTSVITLPSGTKTLLATDGSAANLTSFPTLNQNTTGSAAKWTTGRTISLTGDVTGTSGSFDGSGNLSFAATIAADSVTLAKMANLAANSIMGNNTAGAVNPIALTVAQTKTLLAIAQADVAGLTTASSPQFTKLGIGQAAGTEAVCVTGKVELSAGTGTQKILAGGTLATKSTVTSCTSTGEDTLWDVTIPANTLAVDGDRLYFQAFVDIGAQNGSTTKLKIKFGTGGVVTIPCIGLTADRAYYVDIMGYLVRYNGNTFQNLWVEYCMRTRAVTTEAITKYSAGYTCSETLSNDLHFKITGDLAGGPDANDFCTLYRAWIDYMPSKNV